jgi:hypothetical protein
MFISPSIYWGTEFCHSFIRKAQITIPHTAAAGHSLCLTQSSAITSPRHETVAALYSKLQAYRFIRVSHVFGQYQGRPDCHLLQVCGTPASDKLTPAQLVYQYMKPLEPSTPLIGDNGWDDALRVSGAWFRCLEGWMMLKHQFLIFDETQLTFFKFFNPCFTSIGA